MDTTLIIAAGSALGAAIAYMFKMLVKVIERVGRLEGEKEGIINLSKTTLETVHKAITEKCGENSITEASPDQSS